VRNQSVFSDIRDIRKHISVLNDEVGGVKEHLGVLRNEVKWIRWISLINFACLLALLGVKFVG